MTIDTNNAMDGAEAGLTAFDERHADLPRHLAYLGISSCLALVANWISTGTPPQDALAGMAILVALSILGLLLAKSMPLKLPSVAWISLLAILVTVPGVPGNAIVLETVGKMSFLALATPVLAYAGLALTETEFRIARTAGWKIAIVAVLVMFGTFMGSIVIADFALRIAG